MKAWEVKRPSGTREPSTIGEISPHGRVEARLCRPNGSPVKAGPSKEQEPVAMCLFAPCSNRLWEGGEAMEASTLRGGS